MPPPFARPAKAPEPTPVTAAPTINSSGPSGDPDLAHFSQVFEDYISLRQKCGESIVGLSLEKFTAKLQSNREQIVAKHHCKSAQFTVYEKDGKAALRAVPVRD